MSERVEYAYVTTTGRRTNTPHRIEIWFADAPNGPTIYLLAGGRERSDWVRNLQAGPACTVEIGERTFTGHARMIEGTDEDEIARTLVHDKYADGDDLVQWRKDSLPVAVDLS